MFMMVAILQKSAHLILVTKIKYRSCEPELALAREDTTSRASGGSKSLDSSARLGPGLFRHAVQPTCNITSDSPYKNVHIAAAVSSGTTVPDELQLNTELRITCLLQGSEAPTRARPKLA